MMEDIASRDRVCRAAQQLWLQGMMPGESGMVSMESRRRRFLVTPPTRRRADLAPVDLLCVDIGGVDMERNASLDPGEWRLHRLAYQAGPAESAARAAVLAQPPALLALLRLTGPGIASLALPPLPPLPIVETFDEHGIKQALAAGPAVLVRDVGVLAAHRELAWAVSEVERLEHAARIELACRR